MCEWLQTAHQSSAETPNFRGRIVTRLAAFFEFEKFKPGVTKNETYGRTIRTTYQYRSWLYMSRQPFMLTKQPYPLTCIPSIHQFDVALASTIPVSLQVAADSWHNGRTGSLCVILMLVESQLKSYARNMMESFWLFATWDNGKSFNNRQGKPSINDSCIPWTG